MDLNKEEEDFKDGEGATDIPITMTQDGEITHIQLDGKINSEELKKVVEMAQESAKEIYEIQKKALKESVGGVE